MAASTWENFPGTRKPWFSLICGWAGSRSTLEKIRKGQSDEEERVGGAVWADWRLWKWKWSRSVVSDSLVTPWTVAHQAPPYLRFSRREYWSGLPFPSPGNLPDPGIESRSPTFQAEALTSEPPGDPQRLWGEVKNSESLPDISIFNAQHETGIICARSIEQGSTLRKL